MKSTKVNLRVIDMFLDNHSISHTKVRGLHTTKGLLCETFAECGKSSQKVTSVLSYFPHLLDHFHVSRTLNIKYILYDLSFINGQLINGHVFL